MSVCICAFLFLFRYTQLPCYILRLLPTIPISLYDTVLYICSNVWIT